MQKQKQHHNQPHLPVLLEDTLKYLAPKQGESYLDLTAGYGGHASRILEKTKSPETAVLVDRDPMATEYLGDRYSGQNIRIINKDFLSAVRLLAEENQTFDMILMDLGLSSPQLDIAERGFSFMRDAPLDMRMNNQQGVSAADIVNGFSKADIVKLIKEYGEEPRAAKIAEAIISSRPINTTKELADTIENVIRRSGKIHPATRTFQALRIAVNDELHQIEATLELLPELINQGGRLAVISFHSLEDRLVKQFFKNESLGYLARFEVLNSKPVIGADNDVNNPRARSAKLRAGVKIKKERS